MSYLLLKDLAKAYTAPIWIIPKAVKVATKSKRRKKRRR